MSKKNKKNAAVNPAPEGENLENEGNPGEENKDDNKDKEGFLDKAKKFAAEKVVPAVKTGGVTVAKTAGKVFVYGMAAIGTVGTVLTVVAKAKAGKASDPEESEAEESEEDTPEGETAEPTEE